MEITVQPGDTLSHIAHRYLGDATRWPQVYRDNAERIAAAQRMPARSAMRGPDWIFPGLVLRLPA